MEKTKRKKSEIRKEEILEAACEVFLEKGYAQSKVEEIAKKSNVAKGLVFFYFSSKEELFKEVLKQYGHSPIKKEVELLITQHQTLPIQEQFIIVINFMVHFLNSNPRIGALLRLFIAEFHREPELARYHNEQLIQPIIEVILNLFQKGVEKGEWKEENIPKHFQIILAPIVILIIWNNTFTENHINLDAYAKDFSQFLLRSLGIGIA